jgi:hypothetical protein
LETIATIATIVTTVTKVTTVTTVTKVTTVTTVPTVPPCFSAPGNKDPFQGRMGFQGLGPGVEVGEGDVVFVNVCDDDRTLVYATELAIFQYLFKNRFVSVGFHEGPTASTGKGGIVDLEMLVDGVGLQVNGPGSPGIKLVAGSFPTPFHPVWGGVTGKAAEEEREKDEEQRKRDILIEGFHDGMIRWLGAALMGCADGGFADGGWADGLR